MTEKRVPTATQTCPASTAPSGAVSPPRGSLPDIDLSALRARYRAERDKRLRPDGVGQYVPATGDFSFYADDPWTDQPRTREVLQDEVEALVIGGGFGGLTAAAHLRDAGLEHIRVVDKAGDFGGTWYWNRYPGIACDIESYIYLPMLERIGVMPSRKYAPGGEIRRHARRIGEHFDLYRDALFGTEVQSLTWDDATNRWIAETDHSDIIRARYVVVSSGPFNRPKLPGIPGVDAYRGHTFHTSRWDYNYTGGDADGDLWGLANKRVAVIGTGATAIQCVPHIARSAQHLYVVQRTPSAVDERNDAPTDPLWWSSLQPGWQRRRRENFLSLLEARPVHEDHVGDRWTDTAPVRGMRLLAAGAADLDSELVMELADAQKMTELRDRVAREVADTATAAALQPWYRQMCKRPAFSDTYLTTFNRDNVTLLDTDGRGVERFTPDGLMIDGTEYPVDAVVFATGFELGYDPAERTGVEVRGRNGITLSDHWAGGLRTFQGWVTRGFPNLLHLGVSQNAVSVNFAHVLEEQAVHIAAVVAGAEARCALVEPSAEAEDRWVATIRSGNADGDDFLAECTPGYYNAEGRPVRRVESFAPGAVEFHRLLRQWRSDGNLEDVLVPEAQA